MFVKLIQDGDTNFTPFELDNDSYSLSVRFILDVGYTLDLFCVYELHHAFEKTGLVDLIRNFCDNNGFPTILFTYFYVGPGSENNMSPAGSVCIPYALSPLRRSANK